MKIDGDPASWSKEDFIGFDQVGDCLSSIGDITSVYTVVKDNSLFLRVTFDDMYNRNIKNDYFLNSEISIDLTIKNKKKFLYQHFVSIDAKDKKDFAYYYIRTPEYNLFELALEWLFEVEKDDLVFELSMASSI